MQKSMIIPVEPGDHEVNGLTPSLFCASVKKYLVHTLQNEKKLP